MIIWLVIGAVFSLLASLRLRRPISGTPLPVCGRCRYDLRGLSAYAICPECGSPDRLRRRCPRRMIFVPRAWRLAVVWFAFLIVPLLWVACNLLRTIWRYQQVESLAAAWSNATVGITECLTAYLELMPTYFWLIVAVLVWPRRYARWAFALAILLVVETGASAQVAWHRFPMKSTPGETFFWFAAISILLRLAALFVEKVRFRAMRPGGR